jgi:hypothetical protein
VGTTSSSDFPLKNALYSKYRGNGDVFVTKLFTTGDGLWYSTYLGGTGSDAGVSVAVDNRGNAYLTGWTDSSDFPVKNAFQSSRRGTVSNSFVTKIDAYDCALFYSSYLGGTGFHRQPLDEFDRAAGIAVDPDGNAYVIGAAFSSDFPTKNAFQPHKAGTTGPDAFVTKITAH